MVDLQGQRLFTTQNPVRSHVQIMLLMAECLNSARDTNFHIAMMVLHICMLNAVVGCSLPEIPSRFARTWVMENG